MNINIISFTGFDSLSGSNLRLFFLAKEMIRRGNRVKFITPGKSDAASCERRFGAEAVDLGLEIKRFESSRLKKYPVFALRAPKKVDNDAELVFGQSLPSALAVRRSKTKAKKVIDYVDLWSEYWLFANPGIKGRMVYGAVRRAESHSMNVDRVLTITDALKSMLVERGAEKERVSIVRDGVDTRMFSERAVPESFYERYGIEKGTDYVLYQGGIAAHDGVQFLVDAASMVLKQSPGTKFLIVGDGEYLPVIKQSVMNLGMEDSFVFTGWVPYEDMPYFMNVTKLNIVPIPDSPATRGVVTLKLFEAMACGTPTVIGDMPGVREAVKHKESAYLLNPENQRHLANGISELMDSRSLYQRIRKNGMKLAGQHDWRDIAREMADVAGC